MNIAVWYSNLRINPDETLCYDAEKAVCTKEIEVYHQRCYSERHYKGHCAAWFDKRSNVDHFRAFWKKSLNIKEIWGEAAKILLTVLPELSFLIARGYAKSY